MHPRTAELLAHLAVHRETLQQALAAAPVELRGMRPAPERWSVAEVLEHLATVEAQVVALLRRGVQQARADGPLPPLATATPVVPTIDGARLLDRERRIPAGAGVLPARGLDADAAWAELAASRDRLVRLLHDVDGQCTDAIHAPHFVLGTLTFAQWIVFLGFHEARHAAQIATTVAALGGSGGAGR